MSAADPLGALRTYLLADTGVNTATGGLVRCFKLHPAEIKTAADVGVAAVVLKPAGGPGARGYQQFGKKRIDVTCYGTTLDESYDIYLAVQPVLQQLKRAVVQNVLLHEATEESAGSSGVDPFTQWPTTYSSWLLLSSDTAAA